MDTGITKKLYNSFKMKIRKCELCEINCVPIMVQVHIQNLLNALCNKSYRKSATHPP